MEEINYNDISFKITVASFLHDIGKFKYRCIYSKKPDEKNKVGHDDMRGNILKDTIISQLGILSFLPKSSESYNKIVWLGDYLASAERDPLEDGDGNLLKNKFVLNTPFLSIFSQLNVFGSKNKKRFIKSIPLSNFEEFSDFGKNFEELYFGDDEKNNCVFTEQNYNDFLTEFKFLSQKYYEKDFSEPEIKYRFILELEALYKNYLSLVPGAAYVDEPDIGLYQHSKIAGLISSSLFGNLYKQNNSLKDSLSINSFDKECYKIYDDVVQSFKNKTKYESEKENLLFIKGDFSGIQNFISEISSKNALKLLKSKSVYLNLLNKLIPHYVCLELGYSSLNIVYSSGGGFQLIVDNSKENLEKISEISDKINNYLFQLFENKIFLAFDTFTLKLSDLSKENYAKVLKEKLEKSSVNSSKNKRFFSVIKEKGLYDENQKNKNNYNNCKCCKIDFLQNDVNENICSVCDMLIKFGTSLHNNKSIKLKMLEKLIPDFIYKKLILVFDSEIKINNFGYSSELISIGVPSKNGQVIPFFNDDDKENSVVDYKDGFCKLAGLKLDVDNLGLLFTKGFEDEQNKEKSNLSLSRYNQLSFNVSLFFEYIVELLRKEKYSNKIYTIYSGGDDSFFIGNWKEILDFSKELNEAFKIYVGRDDITISMSINFFSPKYPVKKIFEALEEELDFAKTISKDAKDKGRLCILNRTLKINSIEYNEFFELEKNITDSIVNDKFHRTALQVVIDVLLKIEKEILKENNTLFIPNIWNLDYYFERNYSKEENKEVMNIYKNKIKISLKEFCSKAIGEEIKNKEILLEKINYILLALKIAQYKTKPGRE